MSEFIFGMSNLTGEDTGLDNIVVWVSTKGEANHGPRIKVSNIRGKMPTNRGDMFSVSISTIPKLVSGTPKDFSNKEKVRICRWILLNKQVLLDYWAAAITTKQLLTLLKTLP
jgi:hypothetical protein